MKVNVRNFCVYAGVFVAMQCIIGAGVLALLAFLWSRYDHDMKMIALTGVISISSQMMATASTLLVGKAFSSDTSTNHPPALPT